jgi:predicted AlkP superfamily phosphohydrolase/phosphomutase
MPTNLAATAHPAKPVLMIGLDAAESSLIEQWMEEGRLPNLAALRRQGSWARIRPSSDWMVGSLWPSFYESSSPDRFGMYHYLVWRPDLMTTSRPEPSWMPLTPFWRELPAQGRRVIALDVPLCYAPDEYGGLELSGWATHELLQAPGSSPGSLLRTVRQRFGDTPLPRETTYRLTAAQSLAVRDRCVEVAAKVGELGATLLRENPWDLALVCFTSLHRGGHLLWDRTILEGTPTAAELDAFDHALRDIYIACDREIGRLVEAAGPDASIMAFSLHGMGPNADRTCLLPEMLARVLQNRPSEGSSVREERLTDKLRRLVPGGWRARIKRRLPRRLADWLTVYWRTGKRDWSTTRAFVAFCDLDGYVRINLRGRERDGIVPPEEYGPLCERIAEGLRTFRDAETGEPLIREIHFGTQVFGAGPKRAHLPDLVVEWVDSPAIAHRGVRSDRYGSIPWPTPGRHPLGRSGNHRREGFLIAAGPGFQGGGLGESLRVVDLAPTALELLGLPMPASFQGRSILSARPQ